MRKFTISILSLLMVIPMMAIGLDDGTNKANAIDFDWTNGNVHNTDQVLWYNVDLTPVKDAKYLVLYLTNLADEAAAVHMNVSVDGLDATLGGVDTLIAVGGHYRFEFPKEMISTLLESYGLAAYADKITQLSLALQSNQKVALAAKVFKTDAEYVEEVLANTESIDWNKGVMQEALSTKWYDVNIASVKQNKQHLQLSL